MGRVVAAAFLLLGLVLAAAPDGRAAPPEPPPGCDPTRPAVAHHAGGEVLRRKGGPIPCGMYTGFAGGEARIETTEDAVIFAPAGHFGDEAHTTIWGRGGIAVSEDDGATWVKKLPLGMSWHHNDQETFLDRDTGRFFWSVMQKNRFDQVPADPAHLPAVAATPATSHILSSDDAGDSWTYSTACCEITNGGTVLAAPPPEGGDRPVGYPNVVYYCWHASQTFPGRPAEGLCQRSLDGGKTWTYRGHTHRAAVPVHAECPTPGTVTATPDETSEVGGLPVAGPAGSLYMVLTCGGATYLTRSDDEAATWPVVRELPYPGELRVDGDGNLYLMRSLAPAGGHRAGTMEEHDRLLLSVSTDGGDRWREYDVKAPGVVVVESERTALYGGVSCCTNWLFDVGEPGHVAIAYSGRTASQGTTLDGWITETRNALDVEPVFWSAAVNTPGEPLKFATGHAQGADGRGSPLGGPQMNQVGVDIAPDGSPWAAFQADCGAAPEDERCAEWHHQTRGFAGRLHWPRR